jgi:alpha-beta hydrolase superfamily lysophospholipase
VACHLPGFDMRKLIFFTLMMFLASAVSAQSEPANYSVATAKFKQFYNADQPDSIFAMFGPEMRAALPADKWTATTKQIKSQLGTLVKTEFFKYNQPIAQYNATFQNGNFMLNIGLNDKDQFIGLTLTPPQTAAPSTITLDPSLTESAITLNTLSGNIYGTLTMPKDAAGKIPVVLIIAGSGPTDRDGNSPALGLNANIYKLLAYDLGKAGIASVRYDKRMIGQSAGTQKESDLRFDDYIDDAVGFIEMLGDDARFSKVIVAGHSEGSLVGMIACQGQDVKGFISLAGAGEPAEKILDEQMKSKPQYLQDNYHKIMDTLKRGKTNQEVDPQLYPVLRPSIQNYVMSWCRRIPQLEIKRLKMPILIIQGTTDLQVSVDNAEKLKNAKSSATLDIIHGMNHILKDAPADKDQNMATYKDPNLPLNAQMVTDIIDFIKK